MDTQSFDQVLKYSFYAFLAVAVLLLLTMVFMRRGSRRTGPPAKVPTGIRPSRSSRKRHSKKRKRRR